MLDFDNSFLKIIHKKGGQMEFLVLMILWVFYALVIWGVCSIVPGIVITGFWCAAGIAFVMFLLNIFVKPIICVLTPPLTVLTLGIFYLLVNTFILYLASWLVPGFVITGFWSAFFAAFFISFICGFFRMILST